MLGPSAYPGVNMRSRYRMTSTDWVLAFAIAFPVALSFFVFVVVPLMF